MASARSSVIQFEEGAQSELQFQDFTLSDNKPGVATLSPSGTYDKFPDSAESDNVESEDLLSGDKKESSFWKFSYYQSFFDLETSDFLERLKWSFIPVFGRANYLDRQIRPKPDLYGPFWITFCLVYSTAIISNVAIYFNEASQQKRQWAFNFSRVTISSSLIYAYVFLLPIILWGILKRFEFSNRYTVLELICVYGYSLAIFVPISIFWIFDVAWLHWILVIIGISLTGVVLTQVFWPIYRDDSKKVGVILVAVILCLHILLGVGFGNLFFQERVTWTPILPAGNATLSGKPVQTDALQEKLTSAISERSISDVKTANSTGITKNNLINELHETSNRTGTLNKLLSS